MSSLDPAWCPVRTRGCFYCSPQATWPLVHGLQLSNLAFVGCVAAGRQSKKLHPDRNPDDREAAEEAFIKMRESKQATLPTAVKPCTCHQLLVSPNSHRRRLLSLKAMLLAPVVAYCAPIFLPRRWWFLHVTLVQLCPSSILPRPHSCSPSSLLLAVLTPARRPYSCSPSARLLCTVYDALKDDRARKIYDRFGAKFVESPHYEQWLESPTSMGFFYISVSRLPSGRPLLMAVTGWGFRRYRLCAQHRGWPRLTHMLTRAYSAALTRNVLDCDSGGAWRKALGLGGE